MSETQCGYASDMPTPASVEATRFGIIDGIPVFLSLVALVYFGVVLCLPVHPDAGITTVEYSDFEMGWGVFFIPALMLAFGLFICAVYGLWDTRKRQNFAKGRMVYLLAIMPMIAFGCLPFREFIGIAPVVWTT